jgi:hypothetical protein
MLAVHTFSEGDLNYLAYFLGTDVHLLNILICCLITKLFTHSSLVFLSFHLNIEKRFKFAFVHCLEPLLVAQTVAWCQLIE